MKINDNNAYIDKLLIFLFSVVTAIFASVSAFLCAWYIPEWYGVLAGIALMIVAIPLFFIANERKIFLLFSILLNSLGSGFCIGAYYSSFSIELSINPVLIAFAGLVLVSFVVGMLSCIQRYKIVFRMLGGAILLGALISMLVFWIRDGSVFFSFSFFLLIIDCFYYIIYQFSYKDKNTTLRNVAIVNFGIFIVITIIVIIILSEGEALNGLDGISLGGSKKKRK